MLGLLNLGLHGLLRLLLGDHFRRFEAHLLREQVLAFQRGRFEIIGIKGRMQVFQSRIHGVQIRL